MIEMWIILSTVCFGLNSNGELKKYPIGSIPKVSCIQQAEIRNSSVTKVGETAYKVIPANSKDDKCGQWYEIENDGVGCLKKHGLYICSRIKHHSGSHHAHTTEKCVSQWED